MKLVLPLLLVALALTSISRAEVKPNALFFDNALLQQNAMIPVWGSAKEGEKVAVTFDGPGQSNMAWPLKQVHGDCPNFHGEESIDVRLPHNRRENGTVPFGRKGTGTFFGRNDLRRSKRKFGRK